MTLKDRINQARLKAESQPLWVTGWLTQGFLLLLSAFGAWYGVDVSAYVAAALVIGVMRHIEMERRSDYDKR